MSFNFSRGITMWIRWHWKKQAWTLDSLSKSCVDRHHIRSVLIIKTIKWPPRPGSFIFNRVLSPTMIYLLCKIQTDRQAGRQAGRQTDRQMQLMTIQWNLSAMTTLEVKKRWSFQTGGRSRQVQFTWNPILDRNFQKLENILPNRVVFQEGGHSRQVSQYLYGSQA